MAYRPSCSTRITGVLCTLPLLAPRLVTITTGRPVSRSVVPCVPPELSYSSTWSRTHARGLGSYSPSTGIALLNTRRRATPAGRDTSHDRDGLEAAGDGAGAGGRLSRARLRPDPFSVMRREAKAP